MFCEIWNLNSLLTNTEICVTPCNFIHRHSGLRFYQRNLLPISGVFLWFDGTNGDPLIFLQSLDLKRVSGLWLRSIPFKDTISRTILWFQTRTSVLAGTTLQSSIDTVNRTTVFRYSSEPNHTTSGLEPPLVCEPI